MPAVGTLSFFAVSDDIISCITHTLGNVIDYITNSITGII